MSEPTLRPIWTPEDARQAARDAAKHRGIRGEAIAAEDMTPDCQHDFADLDVRPAAGWPDGFCTVRPRRARRIAKTTVAVAVLVLVLSVGALWASTRAKAEPAGMKCVDQFWLIPFQSSRRTICDGPIQPDGSWTRLREFYTPAHNVPLRTTCSHGSYSSSCTTTGGYFQPMTSRGVESYPVTPATILADEPGHIGAPA